LEPETPIIVNNSVRMQTNNASRNNIHTTLPYKFPVKFKSRIGLIRLMDMGKVPVNRFC